MKKQLNIVVPVITVLALVAMAFSVKATLAGNAEPLAGGKAGQACSLGNPGPSACPLENAGIEAKQGGGCPFSAAAAAARAADECTAEADCPATCTCPDCENCKCDGDCAECTCESCENCDCDGNCAECTCESCENCNCADGEACETCPHAAAKAKHEGLTA